MKTHGIDFIDPLADMRNVAHATTTPLYWRFDPHLDPIGNHLLALLVAKHILAERGGEAAKQGTAVEEALKQQFGALAAGIVER